MGENIVIVKDESGRFYIPQFGFNNIPYWNSAEAYMVMVAQGEARDILYQGGVSIAADATIPIARGWNFIPYYPDYELPCAVEDTFYAIRSIMDHVLIVKDERGRFAIPRGNGFSNMFLWRPSRGYQIKVDADCELVYPPPWDGDEAALAGRAESSTVRLNPPPTGRNMSLLVRSMGKVQGDMQAAVRARAADGRLVGVSSPFTFHSSLITGLAVWGDDPTTPEKDGLDEGERFELRLWDEPSGCEKPLKVTDVLEGDGLVYATDELSIVEAEVDAPTLPDELALFEPYPNPFNEIVRIRYALPNAADVRLTVYDISGREAARLAEGWTEAGVHWVVWDAAGLAAGVYAALLEARAGKVSKKLVLVR